ncbi:MAG: LuxR C-terminal-related transcriptional regulator [Euzebya sp.]
MPRNREPASTPGIPQLSPAERHVIELVATGASNREVAKAQQVSAKTVANQLTAVYRKLDVASRTEAVRALLDWGSNGPGHEPADIDEHVLADRGTQQRALAAQQAALAHGRGSVVGLIGAAGLGKTRLTRDAEATASNAGLTVHRLRTVRTAQGTFALLQALATALGDPPLPISTQPNAALTMGEAVLVMLERQAPRGPLLIVAEDLHDVEEGSLAALCHVAEHLADIPAGLVATWRPTNESPSLARLATISTVRTLPLEPLSPQGVDTIVRSRLGQTPSEELRRLLDAADGIPFFVHELLDGLTLENRVKVHRDEVGLTDDSLPGIITRRIGAQLAQLSAEAGHTVKMAALLGPQLVTEELAIALGVDPWELAHHMAEAVDGALLIRDGADVRFRHDLVRQAVVAATPPPEQERLRHEMVRGMAAADAPPFQAADHIAWRNAENTSAAAPGTDFDAVAWLHGMAQAELVAAPASAAGRLQQAIRLTTDEIKLWPLRLDLARARIFGGELDEALAVLEQTAPLGEVIDWARPEATGHPRDVDMLSSEVLFMRGALPQALEHMVSVGRSDHPNAPLCLADAGLTHLLMGNTDTALAFAEESSVHPGVVSDSRGVVAAASVKAWVHTMRLDADQAMRHAEGGLRHAERHRDAHYELPWLTVGQVHLNSHDLGAAMDAFTRGAGQAEEFGIGWQAPMYGGFMATTLDLAGHWRDARVQAQAAIEMSSETTYVVSGTVPFVILARIARRLGDLEHAGVMLKQAENLLAKGATDSADQVIFERARLLTETGRAEEGAAAMQFLLGRLSQGGIWLRIAEFALATRAIADAAGSEDLHAALDEGLEQVLSGSSRPCWATRMAALDQALLDGDLPIITGAVQALVDGGLPRLWAAEIRSLEMQVRLRHTGAARSDRGEVDGILAELVAVGAVAQAAALAGVAADHGLDCSAPPCPNTGFAALSHAEHAILTVLGDGLPNGAIARSLSMSRQRVEGHLAELRRKLDVTSRAELIAIAEQESV